MSLIGQLGCGHGAGFEHWTDQASSGHAAGLTWPGVIMDEHGQTVGRVTLFGIERGHSQSGRIGYWVAEQPNGRGLAGAAVAELAATAFGELGLHRLEAATLVDNVRSQKVLRRNGFTQFGLAPAYTKIGGEWRDHALFQLVNDRG